MLPLLCPERVIGLFTKDAGVVAEGLRYYAGYKYEYLLCALIFCVHGFLNGTGHTRFTLVNNIVSTYVIRLPACFLVWVLWDAGLLGIGWALPLASLVQLIAAYAFYWSGRWKRKPKGSGA